MRGALRVLAASFLLAAAGAARAAVLEGNVFRVTGVWVGGGAGAGVAGSTRAVMSVGQPFEALAKSTDTASFSGTLRAGFLQAIPVPPPGGGGVGGVDPSRDQVLDFTTVFGCLRVTVPAGCFSAPVTLAVSTPSSIPPAVSRVGLLKGSPAAVNLAVNPSLTPRKPLAVRACYRDEDVQGLKESRLRLAVLPAGDDVWFPLGSSPDPGANRVSAAARHLGLWRVVELLSAASLDRAVAFPNPLAPGRGVMTFSNLPAGARLRLYSFSGLPVRELSADGAGQALWDGRDEDGRTVASGTYFVFMRGTDGSRTMKVQVQR